VLILLRRFRSTGSLTDLTKSTGRNRSALSEIISFMIMVPILCPCVVKRVADGQTDKGTNNKDLSSAARSIAPRGMVLVEWPADPDRGEATRQVWYLLHPDKWQGRFTERDKDTHRMWRFHPAELAKRAKEQQARKS